MTSEKSKNKTETPEAEAPSEDAEIAVEAAEVPTDDAPEAEPDAVEPASEPAPQPVARGAGASFLALVAGGVVAGVIGFALGRMDQTAGWIFGAVPDVPAENAQAIGGLAGQVGNLEMRIAGLENGQSNQDAQLDGLNDRFAPADAVATQIADVTRALAALDLRLRDLENRPIPDIGATQEAVAAYEEQLAGMRAMLADELARIEAVQTQALAEQSSLQSETRSAAFLAATARLAAQAQAGGNLDEPLQVLRDLNTAIPPVLETHSSGIASQNSLTARFPDMARATLGRAIELQAEAGEITGFQAFVQKQLGARSLAPRDGDDADAVLARAEAELTAGNLQAAVAEMRALQPMQVPALDGWLADAEIQLSVQQAIAALEPNSAE